MTHTAGFKVNSFYGYDVDDPIPSLLQVLKGEKPAKNEPIRVEYTPGSKVQYSGGGVTIEQQLMIDVTGEAFPQLMKEIVFDKLDMADSTFEEPLPPARAREATSGNVPQWNDYARKLAYIPRDGCSWFMDYTLRPRQIRYRDRPLTAWQVEPHTDTADGHSNVNPRG